MKAWVYILQDGEGGKYYVGSTNNLDRRMYQHNHGHTLSTSRMKNKDLVFFQEFDSLSDARKIELKIKKLKRRDYVEKIIRNKFIKIRP